MEVIRVIEAVENCERKLVAVSRLARGAARSTDIFWDPKHPIRPALVAARAAIADVAAVLGEVEILERKAK